jgi:Family of unknown function (DUF6279)
MTTTFNTMLPSALPLARARSSIIAVLSLALLLALTGCSLVKLGYSQASLLAFRWLDDYVDFDDAQTVRVRAALDETMAWHRRSQLPDYVEQLVRAQSELMSDTTPERVCGWAADLRRRADTVAQHVAPAIAEIGATLTPDQLARIEKRMAERNREWRDDHLQRDPEKRRRAVVKRMTRDAELLYGDLDDAQRELVTRSVAAAPRDAELMYEERLRRQQGAMGLARQLRGAGPGRDDTATLVRVFFQSLDRSPRENYRVYVERLIAYDCAFASALHNTTSIQQRGAAVRKLKGYETDLRELIAEGAG